MLFLFGQTQTQTRPILLPNPGQPCDSECHYSHDSDVAGDRSENGAAALLSVSMRAAAARIFSPRCVRHPSRSDRVSVRVHARAAVSVLRVSSSHVSAAGCETRTRGVYKSVTASV
ncbi:hypothetical protein SRHO_G00145320 [Serrasalmus rhombeus]